MKLVYRILAIAAVLNFVSCGEKEPQHNDPVEAPKCVSTNPENNAVDVPYEGDVNLVIVYDQNIKCLTANQAKITIDGDASIVKVNPYGEKLTVTVNKLAGETKYTLTVPEGAVQGFKENQAGAAQVKLSFTTKAAPLPPTPDPQPDPADNDAWNQMKKLQLGWNMGNHFDAFYNYPGAGDKFLFPNETCWGNPACTKATFTGLYAAGFRSVRIPITWLKMIGPAPDYTIDATWMARIVEVVGWARDAGLQVIINTHHDEDHYLGNEALGHRWLNIMGAASDETVNAQVKAQITGVWTNIAKTFIREGDYLIFEGFNEINDGKWGNSASTSRQAAVLNEWNQVFVDAVRATGGNNATRWLGVPTYCAGPAFIKYFTMPKDAANHTMLAVHCYDPYDYTLAEGLPVKKWGHTMGNSWDEKAVRDVLATLFSNYIAKGIPVYMGEFGCSMRDYNTAEWRCYKYYLEYFVKACKTYGMSCFLWDNGSKGSGSEHHAYIDHGTGQYIDHSKEVVDVMVKAMTNTSSSYTLEYIYDNAPKN